GAGVARVHQRYRVVADRDLAGVAQVVQVATVGGEELRALIRHEVHVHLQHRQVLIHLPGGPLRADLDPAVAVGVVRYRVQLVDVGAAGGLDEHDDAHRHQHHHDRRHHCEGEPAG